MKKLPLIKSNTQKQCHMLIFGCRYDEAVGVIMPAGLSHSTDG